MRSTLIRFTSSEFVESYLRGELYLSSLSTFWDISQGKIPYENNLTEEEIAEIIKNTPTDRQDFLEGVIAQIPRTSISHVFGSMKDHIIHDVRFRLSAYKYCNLLCFFRIDAEDGDSGLLDEDNAAYIFKNQTEFERRVKNAVVATGGRVIMGDIRYHSMMDRVAPTTMKRNSITVISSEHREDDGNKINYATDGTFNISVLNGAEDIYWRGSLDKYDRFARQKEWRKLGDCYGQTEEKACL